MTHARRSPPSRSPQLALSLPGESLPRPGADSRTIALADRIVPYQLRRGRRRTIGLTIDHRGLTVGAPPRSSIADIEATLRHHSEWVLTKLDEWRNRRRPEPLRVADGAILPLLGGNLTLRLATGTRRARAVWHADCAHPQLTLFAVPGRDPETLLTRALQARAREVFAERLAHFLPRLGIAPPSLALSSARTRWGSCSRNPAAAATEAGAYAIRLNWRLIFMPLAIIDYVVAHELAHTREMNHSPRFWAVVETLYPDWRHAREELRRLSATLPTW
ncbi:hypothetical protein OTERR_04220 [Oryzomicrobium terrae]|uniref:YgjP-like metallopeptidase domain-containing protein n=1 Tax=Oryzomicrobium terrae TaxID=1735038 RepID=A0A5C1E6I6_9RHOO|nr:SprT family zinc-dependent metalloprotease [Oryzomicrobium terrae]QEL63898.1 hypothetical protein OTERR_04220 [Oryzomicrobium terrae]